MSERRDGRLYLAPLPDGPAVREGNGLLHLSSQTLVEGKVVSGRTLCGIAITAAVPWRARRRRPQQPRYLCVSCRRMAGDFTN